MAIDLARELARRLDVPVEIVAYDSVGAMVDGARAGAWDIAFFGADPARASEISFTAAFVELKATYLVAARSQLQTIADVDREGVRIAAPARAAYELFLTRTLKRAQLVRAQGAEAAVDLLVSVQVEALAEAAKIAHAGLPSLRNAHGLLDRHELAIEEAKASGLVARAIRKTGAIGVSVAPKAPAQ